MVDRIIEPWGDRTPYGRGEPWPVRVDVQLADGVTAADVERWVPAASLLHSNGDAMDVAVRGGRIVGVRGRAGDRVNRGRLGPKDLFGWQANGAPDRLTRPMVREGGELVETDWDTAMGRIVDRTRALRPDELGFYTSGQLFAEEYWTLGAIVHGGLGSPHLDGNTRLCTATAAEALKQSFGSDGQPGSYDDVDHADVIALYGHNVAATQPVLWSRILDRLAGGDPPRLLCVDPRTTEPARRAAVHLAPRPGTNLPLMNGLLHLVLAEGCVDGEYVRAHTVGFDDLAAVVADYPPAVVAELCGVAEADLRAAADLLGRSDRLLSTVLQGFYQSHQATAAACAVNDVHLLRGMLGRPGCGVLQMNGQPSAQNTRECGADGDLPGFRNWANPDHAAELARIWNVDVDTLPQDGPPTHAMEIFAEAEWGGIGLLWISGTNPAVSLPELARIRRILARDELFVVVQDLFPTETTEFADVVLPAATWGEKTGVLTNADRTVHLAEQAVEPPGQARSDLAIFLDYARRLDLRDRDGAPFPPWRDAESAFAAWAASTAGRPCDQTGLSHQRLRRAQAGAGGIQWPCTADSPDGTPRLYADGRFPAHPDVCENYPKDLMTGDPGDAESYRAANPEGRAMLRAVRHVAPPEPPDDEYPFALLTGRTLVHFHTRTKTGRVPALQGAEPEVWVECCAADAARAGLAAGEPAEVRTRRGRVRARVRIVEVREGVLFLPFHYGYWDAPDRDRVHDRAANELTPTTWDPASKQPAFKTGAAALVPLAAGGRR